MPHYAVACGIAEYIITLFFLSEKSENHKFTLCGNVASGRVYSVRYGVSNKMDPLFSYKKIYNWVEPEQAPHYRVSGVMDSFTINYDI